MEVIELITIMLVYLEEEHIQLMGSEYVKQRYFAVVSAESIRITIIKQLNCLV